MKTNDTLLILFLLSAQITFGQIAASKEIQGQIVVQSTPAEGVNIINSTTQVMAVSDVNGMFSIVVKEGDVLVFSSVNLNPVKHRITVEDLKSNSLQIKMTVREMELKEVVVNENSQITAENLGIIPRGQKKYTPAERRLAAGSGILSTITGSNKILKKNVEVEKKKVKLRKLAIFLKRPTLLII